MEGQNNEATLAAALDAAYQEAQALADKAIADGGSQPTPEELAEQERVAQEQVDAEAKRIADGGAVLTEEEKTAQTEAANKAEQERVDALAAQSQLVTEQQFFDTHFKALEFESLDQVKQVIAKVDDFSTKNEALKKENDALKAAPHFEDENKKRIYDFANKYNAADERTWQDYVTINSTDLDKMEGKEAMKLAYVLSKKDQPRAETEREFELTYKRTYEKNLDKLRTQLGEEDPEYIEEKEVLDLQRKNAERSAKSELKQLKEQYGQKAIDKPQTKEEMATEAVLTSAVGTQLKSWDDGLSKITSFKVKAEGVGEHQVEVTEEVRKTMNTILRPILAQKGNYNTDGTLKGSVEALVNHQMRSLMFQTALDKVAKESWNAALKTVETNITRQPDPLVRQADVSGGKSALESAADGIKLAFGAKR